MGNERMRAPAADGADYNANTLPTDPAIETFASKVSASVARLGCGEHVDLSGSPAGAEHHDLPPTAIEWGDEEEAVLKGIPLE